MISKLRNLSTGMALIASLAGCAGGASTNQSGPSAFIPSQAGTLQLNGTASKRKVGASLYISEQGSPNMIEVFGTNGSGPKQTINKGLNLGPRGLAFDSASNLYVAMPGKGRAGAGAVNEYAYGTSNILRTIKVAGALELAVDASDNLYVLGGKGVYVFAPGSTVPSLSITAGIDLPVHMVLDSSGNIYVANCVNGSSSVTVYSSSGTLIRTITQGVYLPRALAVDNAANVYVGNSSKSVTVYQTGTSKPWKTISGLKGDILSIALDVGQNVYIGTTDNDAVSIFGPAPKFASKRVITNSIYLPISLAFDAQNDLFVANTLGRNVSKYAPGAITPDKNNSNQPNPIFHCRRQIATTRHKLMPRNEEESATVSALLTKRIAIGVAVTVLLAGCTGNYQAELTPQRSSVGGPNAQRWSHVGLSPVTLPHSLAFQKANPGKSWMSQSAASSQALMYASDETSQGVEVFKYDGGKVPTLIGQLVHPFTGLESPAAPCADKFGDVYVPDAYTGLITEYAYGATTPKKTLDDRRNTPTGCSVDPTTGNLAVVNYSHASVSIYKQAMGEPKIHNIPNWPYTVFGAYDNQGNLFVSARDSNGVFGLFRLSRGSTSFRHMTVTGGTVYFPGQLQWSKGFLLIGDQAINHNNFPSGVDQAKVSGTEAHIVNSVSFTGTIDVIAGWEYGSGTHPRYVAPDSTTYSAFVYNLSNGLETSAFSVDGNVYGIVIVQKPR